MTPTERLHVVIDGRVNPASAGGVAQVMQGLIRALGQLDDSTTQYTVVIESDQEREFLESCLGSNQRFALKRDSTSKRVRKVLNRTQQSMQRRIFDNNSNYAVQIPTSDGFFESLDCDVIHFPHQRFMVCGRPTIYNPHDLQHLHFPQFFKPADIVQREVTYRLGCQLAHTVVVSSRWVKEDILTHYQIEPNKVQIVPWAPPTEVIRKPSEEEVLDTRNKYQLSEPFAFYPAMTWPHKNHLRLLEALALIREKWNIRIQMVCTGSRLEPHWSSIQRRIDELDLGSQVRFLGFVSDTEMRAIYKLAEFVVMPSLFESDSSPIYEAWLEGTPVACSNVTSLPLQIMEAGLIFDPYDAMSMAETMWRLSIDPKLRIELSGLGRIRIKDYDWDRTAKGYRAVYRRAVGRNLNEEDRWLLSWDWMERPLRLLKSEAQIGALDK